MLEQFGISRRTMWAGLLTGFSLGGFFDGILLHQILQWHHLLSLVEGVGDLRNQVLFDGLFHLLMYLIGAVGLILLYRARRELATPGSGRLLIATGLLGFGAWHIIDAVLSHWIMGIHRVKLDSPNPLLWDLLWFAAFGVVPAVIGAALWRNKGGGRGSSYGRHAAAAMTLLVLTAAPFAGQPPADDRSAIVVFLPGMAESEIMRSIVANNGALLWEARGIWAVRWEEANNGSSLYRDGALLVSNSILGAGCLAWAQL
jgi:uncharacterized membrane protein